MRWLRRGSCALVFGLWLGCGRVAHDTGGETNWLRCDVDEDCPSGECRQGQCVPPPTNTGAAATDGMSSSVVPASDGLPCDIGALLQNTCWGVGCHGSNTPASSLDMQSAGVETRLVDVPAAHGDILDGTAANCLPGELRIDSANPERSVILKKIAGTQSCGGTMPIAPRTLTAEGGECLRVWVYRLAGKDPGGAGPSGGGGGAAGAEGAGATGGT